MDWQTFYDNFYDWSASTIKTRISSLKDIGPGEEIVEAILNIDDRKIRAQLIRKAIKLKADFTSDDYINLDGELSDDIYRQLGAYAGFDADDPYFDEDNMEWYDFYDCTQDWSKETLIRRINKLSDFGPTNEIVETILLMPDMETCDLLYQRAVDCGVKFTQAEKYEIGNWGKVVPKPQNNIQKRFDQLEKDIQTITYRLETEIEAQKEYERQEKRAKRFAFWLALICILTGTGGNRKNKSNRCDGDCSNCPPHYGYRYGRWYYGHGHTYGCVRSGNGSIAAGRD